MLKNRKKAERLGKDALKELKVHRQQSCVEQNKKLLLRKQALDTEAVRSAYVASLPPVKVVQETVKEDPPKVIRFDKSTLFQTEYVIKDKVVEPVISPKVPKYLIYACAHFVKLHFPSRMQGKQHFFLRSKIWSWLEKWKRKNMKMTRK